MVGGTGCGTGGCGRLGGPKPHTVVRAPSSVRDAADADYRLVVVENGCADRDAAMYTFLMQRLFPRQATVVHAEGVIQAFTRG